MEDEQDDMPFVCPVADCGMRFINEDHLNWHSKKHEMSLALNTGGLSSSSPAHHNFLDQTPTPTKFLKNCEEIGLFQELTPNPFDHAYKKALDDPSAPLPGPPSSGGELNTPTLILTDGHKSCSVAPSPLILERTSQAAVSVPAPTLLLKGSEPLKPSPLATGISRHGIANTAVAAGSSAAQSSAVAATFGLASGSAIRVLDEAPGQLPQVASGGSKVMLDLSGRSVMTDSQSEAPSAKVATVQPLIMQKASPGLSDVHMTEVRTLHTTRFVTSAASNGSSMAKAALQPVVKPEPQVVDEEDMEGSAAQQQQQCTMQVLLQLPTGETVPISIPATISKFQYAGSNQQQQPQQQAPSAHQLTLSKINPAPSTTPVTTSQTTTIKQRLKAQLQSQLSPMAKAGVLGDSVAGSGTGTGNVLTDQRATASAFNTIAVSAATPTTTLMDSTSPIMMLDSPGSEMNLSDSSDYSIDSKRQKMSPDSGDPDERRRKFLERNRAAAARCRQKRKHWISNLEKKADELQSTNSKLMVEVKLLKGEVAQLKTLLIAHKDCPVTQQQKSQGQLQNVLLPDPQAQVVPTVESSDQGSVQLGQIVTILQSSGQGSDVLQGT